MKKITAMIMASSLLLCVGCQASDETLVLKKVVANHKTYLLVKNADQKKSIDIYAHNKVIVKALQSGDMDAIANSYTLDDLSYKTTTSNTRFVGGLNTSLSIHNSKKTADYTIKNTGKTKFVSGHVLALAYSQNNKIIDVDTSTKYPTSPTTHYHFTFSKKVTTPLNNVVITVFYYTR